MGEVNKAGQPVTTYRSLAFLATIRRLQFSWTFACTTEQARLFGSFDTAARGCTMISIWGFGHFGFPSRCDLDDLFIALSYGLERKAELIETVVVHARNTRRVQQPSDACTYVQR